MTKVVGYKQNQEHFNCSPEIKTKISELSSISTCRYDPTAEKTGDIDEFLKRPIKYTYDITVKSEDALSVFKHSCYFDNREDAEKNHKNLRVKYYDQLTAPYLDKIKRRGKLSTYDQDEILGIIKKFDDLKLAS